MSCGFLSQSKLLNYYMSGSKLFCPIYYSHCCMFLFGKIVLKYLFVFCLIWSEICVQNDTSWKTLSKYIIWKFEHIWEVSYSRHFLSTHLSFKSVCFDKVVYQTWSIMFDSLLCVHIYHTPYVYVYPQNILHLVRKCLVLDHLGPYH